MQCSLQRSCWRPRLLQRTWRARWHGLGGPKGAASSLLHLLLPLQQGLTMYYWMFAFQDDPSLVGAGSPLTLFKLSGSSQVTFYLAAAALHLALCMEESVSV